jgi:hypothetical protein
MDDVVKVRQDQLLEGFLFHRLRRRFTAKDVNRWRSRYKVYILFSIRKGFVGEMMSEDDRDELESSGNEFSVHWE